MRIPVFANVTRSFSDGKLTNISCRLFHHQLPTTGPLRPEEGVEPEPNGAELFDLFADASPGIVPMEQKWFEQIRTDTV